MLVESHYALSLVYQVRNEGAYTLHSPLHCKALHGNKNDAGLCEVLCGAPSKNLVT